MTRRSQRGTATVMIVGFFAVLALLVGVVVDASAAYLQRQSLGSLADGAALAAADQAKAASVYDGGVDAPVDLQAAREAAAAYVATSRSSLAQRARLDVTVSNGSVVVTLRAPVRLAVAPPGWRSGTVTASSAATVMVRGR